MKRTWRLVLGILAVLAAGPFARAQDIQFANHQGDAGAIALVGCESGCTSSHGMGGCESSCSSCGGQDCDWCCGRFRYATLNLRGSFDHLESGGFNTEGGFPNTGGADSATLGLGGAFGVAIPRNGGLVRLELEGILVDPLNTVTNSFQPPTPTFFYDTRFFDRYAVLANCWIERPFDECRDVYFGGGIGHGGATMTVDDGVVAGIGFSSDVAFQVGFGIVRHGDRCTFDLGYRYIDWGTSKVNLVALSDGDSAGDFTAHVTSHQLVLGIRYDCLGRLLGR